MLTLPVYSNTYHSYIVYLNFKFLLVQALAYKKKAIQIVNFY